ncbi:hypothetical protein ACEQ8H_006127 [Pleosporales sp. CAS-2024a]
MLSDPWIMLAPPPPPHCAFGEACNAKPGGQTAGPNICSWCKNMSLEALYKQAQNQPDQGALRRLVDTYCLELERECAERIAKGPTPGVEASIHTMLEPVAQYATAVNSVHDATPKPVKNVALGWVPLTATGLTFRASSKTLDYAGPRTRIGNTGL